MKMLILSMKMLILSNEPLMKWWLKRLRKRDIVKEIRTMKKDIFLTLTNGYPSATFTGTNWSDCQNNSCSVAIRYISRTIKTHKKLEIDVTKDEDLATYFQYKLTVRAFNK